MTTYKSSYFRSALYISLINPKAILFFLAFFVQFINPSVQIWKPFTVLGITLQFISFCYLTIIIFTGKYLAVYFKKHIVLNYIGNLYIGILFMLFAYKLFISSI
jgi:leucine efflux protein